MANLAHATWLIAAAALYTVAASLEWLIANAHGVSITSIHEHTMVPGAVHALAIASIPVSLYPVFAKKMLGRIWIRATGVIAIAVSLLAGQTLLAGFLAWAFSAATLAWPPRAT